MPDTNRFLNSKYMDEKSGNIDDTTDDTRDHWEEEIAFLEARLNGEQGDIDADDKASCEEALKIARENLSSLS